MMMTKWYIIRFEFVIFLTKCTSKAKCGNKGKSKAHATTLSDDEPPLFKEDSDDDKEAKVKYKQMHVEIESEQRVY